MKILQMFTKLWCCVPISTHFTNGCYSHGVKFDPITWKRYRKFAFHPIFTKFGQWDDFIISQFSVFMWRNPIPKWNITSPSEVLVLSQKRTHSNVTFHNVLARQGPSYCNRAHLNFQAFALCDMKIATQEGCRVGQKMSYHFNFC